MRPLLFLGISLLCLVVQQNQASPFLWSTWKALTCWSSSSSSESDSTEDVLGSSSNDGHYSGIPLMELFTPSVYQHHRQQPQHQANSESLESANNEVRQSNHVRSSNPRRNPDYANEGEYNQIREVSPSHYSQPQLGVRDNDNSSSQETDNED